MRSSAKESLLLYAGYVTVAALFGAWVWFSRGAQSGLEFFTGYLIEQSLAMDNMFVIATIFGFLAIPRIYQHRVLFWGIIGVIIFRAIFIGLGAALVYSFSWILVLFGAFLVFTGIRMFGHKDAGPDMGTTRSSASCGSTSDQPATRRAQLHDQAARHQDRQDRPLP